MSVYDASGVPGGVEQALSFGVSLDQRDQARRAAGKFEVADRLGVDREDPAGRPIFGGHVGDGRPVGQGEAGEALAVELDELADHALAAELLGDGQDQVGRRRPLAEAPRSLKPTTCGTSIETGWPSIAASASIPPTPQPSTPRPLIIVVCESVPTRVSG